MNEAILGTLALNLNRLALTRDKAFRARYEAM